MQVTKTQLEKAVMDATASIREVLVSGGIHDFSKQGQGPQAKVKVSVKVLVESAVNGMTASLYRPRSGDGDPRFWIHGLGGLVKAGDWLGLFVHGGTFHILNLTHAGPLDHLLAVLSRPEARPGLGGQSSEESGTAPEVEAKVHPTRVTMTTHSAPTNEVVLGLYSRSFGGPDAAAVPNITISTKLPDGPPPAGVEVMRELFRNRVQHGNAPRPFWAFMVGGPGNGKSHQLTKLLADLDAFDDTSKRSGGAGRYVKGLRPSVAAQATIVNDATIRPPDEQPAGGYLLSDLADAYSLGKSLWFNINRGVILEDAVLAERASKAGGVPGLSDVIRWLLGVEVGSTALTIEGSSNSHVSLGFLSSGNSEDGIDLMAIHLDVLSLLERPVGHQQNAGYRLMRMDDAEDRKDTAIGRLLFSVVDSKNFEDAECKACTASKLCPFLANARNLRPDVAGPGILRLMRAAEQGTRQLFTYRDAWTVIASAVIGRTRPEFSKEGPCGWVQSRAEEPLDKPSGRVSLVELASQRLQFSLFDTTPPEEPLRARGQGLRMPPASAPVRRLFVVDPTLDVSGSWAAGVGSALEGIAYDLRPTGQLNGSPRLAALFHELDYKFEEAVLKVLGEERLRPTSRRAHLRWFGEALYRVVGLAVRQVAHMDALSEMTALWLRTAEHLTASGPLYSGLHSLLLPANRYDQQGRIFVTLLASRAEPVTGFLSNPTLCVVVQRSGAGAPELGLRVLGDQLVTEIKAAPGVGDEPTVQLPIDLGLAREALAYVDGSGFTDASASSIPRVERFRAALLRNDPSRPIDLAVVGTTIRLRTS